MKKQGNPYPGVSTRKVYIVEMSDGSKGSVYAINARDARRQFNTTYRKWEKSARAVKAYRAHVSKR